MNKPIMLLVLAGGFLPCRSGADATTLFGLAPFPVQGVVPEAERSVAVDSLLDNLPGSILASLETRQRLLESVVLPNEAMGAIAEDAVRWEPGSTVTVAFLGGTSALHKDIAEATSQLLENCNLTLDFGYNAATRSYRKWSANDVVPSANIRVSFDLPGYWSLVGLNSSDPDIADPRSAVGGGANQRSMNLARFASQRPADWKRITRHEFMHALGFHHEHQHPNRACDAEFRWENDADYKLTTNESGVYINDSNGHRPGIYTYLSGAPNYWEHAKVDHNLKPLSTGVYTTDATVDASSIMLYRFPELFYQHPGGTCTPIGSGENLSDGDKNGLRRLYPANALVANALVARQKRLFDRVLLSNKISNKMKVNFQKNRQSLE